jgi:outer membrane protein
MRAAPRLWAVCAVAAAIASAAPCRAETLADAIALAYQTNPGLQSQRAQVRSVDETYVQARSQYGPTVQVEARARYTQDQLRNSFQGATRLPDTTIGANQGSAQVSISQPLYTGGRATLDTKAAEFSVLAARESLRVTEGDIVFSVIQSYLDVLRDQKALAIRERNLAAVIAQLNEIRARKRAGEITLTDVAQAEAQFAAEQINLTNAQNQLRTSRIGYATVVGRNPGQLEEPPQLPNLPQSITQAWEIAGHTSPEFQQARYAEEQSRARLASTKSSRRPTIALRGSFSYQSQLIPFGAKNYDRATVGEVVLTLPFFSGGLNSSITRQAVERNTADRIAIEAARRTMIQTTTNAWNQAITFRTNVKSEERQVDAATLAFKGTRIEYRAGQRSTFDVLIAGQVLRDAELGKLSFEHDAYLAEALLLRFVGRLDADDIVASLPRYDPAEHFRKVEHKGALPWEPLIRQFDAVLTPRPAQRSIPAPAGAIDPSIGAAGDIDIPDWVPVVAVPVEPIPGTTTNVPPPIARKHR